MKKHLLLGSALLAAISAFPQNASVNQRVGTVNMAERIAQKFAMINSRVEQASTSSNYSSGQTIQPSDEPSINLRTSALATNWAKVSGSMNIYGMLVSSSKPLQYNDELNVVSFVHRKSNTYAPTPVPTTSTAASGALVALISSNWGTSWDSTCVWNDNNNWARYPQGGIVNPVGNTSLANARIVAIAPITQVNTALGWIGSAVAWKALGPGTYNNSSVAANGTFVANTSPYGPGLLDRKFDFPRLDFSANDDGTVWALGQIFDGDVNATTVAGQAYRGARLLKGTFASGNIVWTTDSVVPNTRTNSVTGDKFLISSPGMAWSEDGQTGYVWHIGASATNSVDANRGYQPIISKTTDGGTNWMDITGIDFNDPSFTPDVLNHVQSARNSTLTIPFFNFTEGISGVVDNNNRLHLVSTVWATAKSDPDSVGYTYQYTNYDGDVYTYPHDIGIRPYLYDFTGDGVGPWKVTMIDSLSSEDPGTRPADDGYSDNPWDPSGGTAANEKVSVDARIQASRTADGKYVVYTWAETDTILTTVGSAYKKWNVYPNIKARMMDVANSSQVSPTEINISKLKNSGGSVNSSVANLSYNHYTAPRCLVNLAASNTNTLAINLPVTISNSPGQLLQLQPVNHWYATAGLEFARVIPTGVAESNSSASNSLVYPNPAKGNAALAINLKSSSTVEISVVNMVGQVVKTSKTDAQTGVNTINIDLNGLSKGVYMVNVKADNASSTKKLVVE